MQKTAALSVEVKHNVLSSGSGSFAALRKKRYFAERLRPLLFVAVRYGKLRLLRLRVV